MKYRSYGSKLLVPPTNYHLLAAQQEPHKKTISEQKMLQNFLEKGRRENGPLAQNDKTERRTKVCRKAREQIGTGNQMADEAYATW